MSLQLQLPFQAHELTNRVVFSFWDREALYNKFVVTAESRAAADDDGVGAEGEQTLPLPFRVELTDDERRVLGAEALRLRFLQLRLERRGMHDLAGIFWPLIDELLAVVIEEEVS
jgi:hypothetical protein